MDANVNPSSLAESLGQFEGLYASLVRLAWGCPAFATLFLMAAEAQLSPIPLQASDKLNRAGCVAGVSRLQGWSQQAPGPTDQD